MINYHGKKFRSVRNTENGQVNADTVFYYRQHGSVVTATYAGGDIATGHLIALVGAEGKLEMRYHHVDTAGVLMTGRCHSIPEVLPCGKLRLHETWQWTSGDGSSGHSVVEEI